MVDLLDYAIWGQNFGRTNCGNVADLNGDCLVDIRDYGMWRANFGHSAGAARPSGSPTPQSAPLLPPRPALATDLTPPADRPDAERAALADDRASEKWLAWAVQRTTGSVSSRLGLPQARIAGGQDCPEKGVT